MGENVAKAGTASTDLALRTCDHPSYGDYCPPETPLSGFLLASYTWAQDVRRLGALAQLKGTSANDTKLEIMLDNIGRIRDITPERIPKPVDHHAHAWYNDEPTRGAIALFGLGQSGHVQSGDGPEASLFASIKVPAANGKLHFAGEATSAHHAWVTGSLNSARRAACNALEGRPESQNK